MSKDQKERCLAQYTKVEPKWQPHITVLRYDGLGKASMAVRRAIHQLLVGSVPMSRATL